MGQVFLSHSTKDVEIAKKIHTILLSKNVKIWASFADIKFGEEWDKAIQSAMDSSSHILVLASQASLESSYVRAEVEYAINLKKIVIPMIIENITLPLRWHTLQAINLDGEVEWEKKLREFSLHLPKNIKEQISAALEDQEKYDQLLNLLYENPSWVERGAKANVEVETNNISSNPTPNRNKV